MKLATALFFVFAGCIAAVAQAPQNPGSQRPVTQQEIDQLKQQILNEDRSSLEAITDYHHETGDLNNRLDHFRYGGKLNLRLGSDSGAYLTATRTNYMTINSAFDQWGTNFTAGIVSRLSESADLQLEGGATRFSTDTTTINGSASFRFKYSDTTGFYATASRSNVEESLLSTAGVRPVLGPFAGQLVGRVMDNRFVFGGSSKLPANFDVFGEGGLGNRQGSNVPSNFFKTAGGGVGYTVVATGNEDPLSLLRAAFEVDYAGFNDNRFGFGGASFTTRTGSAILPARLGSDLLPTVPTVTSPGVGGYFSPRNFVSGVFRGEAQGGSEASLSYRVSAFIGSQTFTNNPRHRANGVSGTVTAALTDRLSVPVTYLMDNYGPFTQQSLYARLVVRF